MSWTIFRINVLSAMVSGQFKSDIDSFAEFYANEYHSCIQRGGDMIYGVPIMNGNVQGMIDVIKGALKKGQESGGENFNILAEIYPSAFDAYWMGAEMAPVPNPLINPKGWVETPPAPGTIQNIGPNPTNMAASAAAHKAEVKVKEAAVDELKKQTITIPGIAPLPDITIPVYETVEKILKKEKVDKKVEEHPTIKGAKEIVLKLKEAKKKKPSIGSQVKKSVKFPFPELPKKQKIIDDTRDKLVDAAVVILEETLIPPIEEIILAPIYATIESAVAIAESIPSPKPTKEQIKKFVKDTKDGLVPDIELPGISIPKIPTKAELKDMVKDKTPTKEELKSMAYDLIKDKIPEIPNIWFIPPTIVFSYPTNIMIEPFINLAKFHLMGTSGMMSVIAQYPYPAPPAPAILNWIGYKVIG
jgi:hypothetical protein